MKIAKVLKVSAVIVWVLGFIVGLLPIITAVGYSSYSYSGYVNWSMYLYAAAVWFGFFVAGIAQYGFAVMLENVALMRRRTEEQLYYLTGAVQHLEGAVAQNAAARDKSTDKK